MEAGPKYREFPITWERGLIETVEDSMLPPGAAARLRNWVADTSGNLRARVGWSLGSLDGDPSTKKGWGIGHLALQRRPAIRQSATDTTAAEADPLDVAAAWSQATLDDSLLVARIYVTYTGSTGSNEPTTGEVSVTPPANWVRADPGNVTNDTSACFIYYKEGAASESGTVTFTVTHSAAVTIAGALEIQEIVNVETSGALETGAASTTTGTNPPAAGTATAPTIPVGIAIAAAVVDDSGDFTFSAPTNDFTISNQFFVENGSEDLNAVGAHRIYTDTSATSVDFTYDGSPDSGEGCIALFKGSGFAATDGFYIVANNEDPDMKLYYIDRDDPGSGTWNLLQTHSSTAADTVPFAFTSGNEMLFWVHPSLTDVWAWGGTGFSPAAISGSPPARCVAWHKSRLYVGGDPGEPWKLHFSEIGDHTTWSGGTAGNIEVGKGDGEAIEDILPFEDGLLIGKQTSLWLLLGSGPGSHRLIRIPQGGCAPGRTLLATEYGAIVAGKYEVHLYTQGQAQLISRPIRDSYGMTGSFLTCSVRDESAYICDQGSGTVWAIDFANGGTWREEMVGSASTEGPACIFNQGRDQLFAPKNASVGSLLNYRRLPGSSRTKDFTGVTQAYEAWTPEMWLAGPSKKFTPMFLFMKIRQRAGDSGDGVLTVTPYVEGSSETAITITPEDTAGVRWYRKRLPGAGIASLQLRVTQTLASTDTAVLDLEETRIGYSIEDKR